MRSLMTHLGCLGALLTVLPALVGVADGSDRIEVLGNPYEGVYPSGESVYARNIWDLQASDGKLYIGAGNSSNVGPAVNAGPVPIICFDPSSGLFEKQFTVDDEQIDVYRVLDGWLYIPGHDPRESWDLGNFYRLEETGWTKHRNIPHAIHTYDMLYHQGILFAAGSGMHVAGEAAGKDWAGALVSVSRNGGATWSNVELGGFRIHNLLIVDGVVYAADVIAGPQWEKGWRQYAADSGVPNKAHANIYEFDGQGGFAARHDLGVDDIFPGAGLTEEAFARMVKPAAFGPKSVYIGALCHNDHQFIPFGLFVAGSLRKGSIDVQQIGLPPGSRPWDLLVRGGRAYVLLDTPEEGGHVVSVLASSDLNGWQEVLRFRSAAFARSLELMGDYAYFGLGCETTDPGKWRQEELLPETGRILRVRLPAAP